MIRHIHWYVVAPEREDEGESALKTWVARMQGATGFRGAAVLREADHMQGVLSIVQDWDSVEDARAFNAANKSGNPTLPDIAGPIPPDQGAVLFDAGHKHGHGGHEHGDQGHSHGDHGDHGHESQRAFEGLDFNRGGGLLARLLHGHFEVVSQSQP